MKRSPRTTVVIPARNAARFIAQALESVRAQEFADFEAVVVDDGSSDETFEIASRFASEDARFSVIGASDGQARGGPIGPGPARNVGVRRSQAEFVAFLDADDTWLPQRLGSGVGALEGNPEAGLAYGLTMDIDEAGKELRDEAGQPLLRGRGSPGLMPRPVEYLLWPGNIATVNAIMVRRTLALGVGGFPSGLMEDWRFNFRAAAVTSFHFTPEVIATYRRHPACRSSVLERDPERAGEELLKLCRDSLAWLARRPGARRLARRLAARHLPAHLVRGSITRRGRVRRARLLRSTLAAMWEFPSLALSPHALKLALALVAGGAVYRLLRGARDSIAPGLLFAGRISAPD
ncbi:MAG: glycosyltransferase family 2 protein [Planctomycetota bacterium]